MHLKISPNEVMDILEEKKHAEDRKSFNKRIR